MSRRHTPPQQVATEQPARPYVLEVHGTRAAPGLEHCSGSLSQYGRTAHSGSSGGIPVAGVSDREETFLAVSNFGLE
jgi:hypothetical protein